MDETRLGPLDLTSQGMVEADVPTDQRTDAERALYPGGRDSHQIPRSAKRESGVGHVSVAHRACFFIGNLHLSARRTEAVTKVRRLRCKNNREDNQYISMNTGDAPAALLFTNDLLWVFICSQPQKHGMPNLIIECPLGKLDLRDQDWLDPGRPPHNRRL